jgi:hypothetical protein
MALKNRRVEEEVLFHGDESTDRLVDVWGSVISGVSNWNKAL